MIMNIRKTIEDFPASYGACLMGTGILSITSYMYSNYLGLLKYIGFVLVLLNTLLAFIIVPLWTLKWIMYFRKVSSELSHPILANFYPTTPIGLMILGVSYIKILGLTNIGELLWFIGAFLTFVMGVIIPYNLFKSEAIHLEHINPSFFIPPVGLIVIPIGGGIILSNLNGELFNLGVFFNIVSWGSGFFIYLALLAVCVNRFLLHKPLPSVLAPTMWINLGPIGAGTVALYNLTFMGKVFDEQTCTAINAFLILFWGSGVWWLLLAILMTLHYYVFGKGLPFAPSWWAFTFPLGAYVAATHIIHTLLKSYIIDIFGLTLYVLLFLLWLMAFIGTTSNILKKIA